MQKILILLIFLFCTTLLSIAQEKETKLAFDNYHRYYGEARQWKDEVKDKAMLELRNTFAKNPYRYHSLGSGLTAQKYLEQLDENGIFSDLKNQEENLRKNNGFQKISSSLQEEIGLFLTNAFNRIWKIADAYRKGEILEEQALSNKVLKAILHYGTIEAGRPNDGPRFHASCFAMPTAAASIYFCLLKQMNKAESGQGESLLNEACAMLKVIGLQAWTQPLRHDETDQNVVSIPRFRNHVWWVGGNALAYRSLLPVAAMYRSVPMINLLSEICQKGISMTSQATYSEAFWTEGFTADGAGWGHGKQCLIWGYPIDGTSNALNMLSMLKHTPWEQKLTRENVDALLNYFQGSNYYYYKGYILPCLDRGSMVYKPEKSAIRYQGMLKTLLNDWQESFTKEELKELERLYNETQKNEILMPGYQIYNGTRWFFNNDDLVKKNKNYHIIVNMASVRCDGLESAHTFADAYNYYTTDGATMFQKTGNEYRKAFGAYDVTAFPGVTAREGMNYLPPITNWRGYCSKYNYAAATTSGGENAAAGYIFEKMNASEKENVNDKGTDNAKSDVLYGVKAYKSYFMIGDYTIALGAGITNKTPNVPGIIRTTIEQTEHTDSIYLYKGEGIDWIVQQGKFSYSVLPAYRDKMHYICETKATDWIKMNPSNKNRKNLPGSVNIFRMWIDHGKRPENDTYGYAVYAGEGMPAKQYPFEVLRNDTLIQAVWAIDRKVIGAVFYDSQASLEAKGLSLSVSVPCAILIERNEKETILSVTDAQMDKNCKKIKVIWNGKTYSCDMPQEMLLGKPAVLHLKN